MSRLFTIIISVLFLVFSASCQSTKEKEKGAIEALIKTNAESFEKENLDGYIATLDPESPELENTRAMMGELFKKYDLKIKIENVRILKVGEDKADVEVVQVTEKVTGGDFRNNRVDIIHHLKKINGAWKISGSDTIKIDYFDQSKDD